MIIILNYWVDQTARYLFIYRGFPRRPIAVTIVATRFFSSRIVPDAHSSAAPLSLDFPGPPLFILRLALNLLPQLLQLLSQELPP